jgi:hypothetical protein
MDRVVQQAKTAMKSLLGEAVLFLQVDREPLCVPFQIPNAQAIFI